MQLGAGGVQGGLGSEEPATLASRRRRRRRCCFEGSNSLLLRQVISMMGDKGWLSFFGLCSFCGFCGFSKQWSRREQEAPRATKTAQTPTVVAQEGNWLELDLRRSHRLRITYPCSRFRSWSALRGKSIKCSRMPSFQWRQSCCARDRRSARCAK